MTREERGDPPLAMIFALARCCSLVMLGLRAIIITRGGTTFIEVGWCLARLKCSLIRNFRLSLFVSRPGDEGSWLKLWHDDHVSSHREGLEEVEDQAEYVEHWYDGEPSRLLLHSD